jgi:Golgi nucleoside diphosphatase
MEFAGAYLGSLELDQTLKSVEELLAKLNNVCLINKCFALNAVMITSLDPCFDASSTINFRTGRTDMSHFCL